MLYGLRDKQELLQQLGDMRQVAGFQRVTLMDGRGKGNEVIHVRNGSGLQFQIAVSRGFDIGLCEFYGMPISWISHTGPVAPYFYEKDGVEWGRGWEGGLLTTCGLTYMGKPSIDQGQQLGQHGRISYSPVEILQMEGRWVDQNYEMIFRGKAHESKALEENITLERTIITRLGENRLYIKDVVANEAHQPVEHMILHHFNFGYPLISETSKIHIPNGDKRWINGEGQIKDWDSYPYPNSTAKPSVMVHENLETTNGRVHVGIENKVIHNGAEKKVIVRLNYPYEASPFLTQWKYPAHGINVLGIEPCNVTTEGRGVHRERGTLPFLAAGEQKEYCYTLDFELKEGRS